VKEQVRPVQQEMKTGSKHQMLYHIRKNILTHIKMYCQKNDIFISLPTANSPFSQLKAQPMLSQIGQKQRTCLDIQTS